MPFKGDRRLGGPHDNEAHLNGTSSDFDSVPAYGTVISGPTDTSRYVNDYLGTPFYMPYSTTVYANGTGGTYSVETWGLQYFPAGYVTSQTIVQLDLTWLYSLANSAHQPNGTINYGHDTFNNIEDGTGINYSALVSTTLNYTNGQIIQSDTFSTGADRYRVMFNATGPTTSLQDFTMYPEYGIINGYSSGNLTYVAPCQTFNIGTYSSPNLADGYGGESPGDATNNYYGATYLGHCGNQNPDWLFYYHDGAGNVSTGNAPAGFTLSESPSSSSFQWSAPDGTAGTFTYQNCNWATIADGNGGSYGSGGCADAYNGQMITNGSYSYQDGTDENGDPIYSTAYYSLSYNGAGGYNTNYT